MLKLNKKGFALIETLVVTVFVATIFSMMYTNFFPMMGEYERRETYDDIDTIYKTYLIKRMLEDSNFSEFKKNISNLKTSSPYYKEIFSAQYDPVYNKGEINMKSQDIINSCNKLTTISESRTYCQNLFTEIKATKIYLASYNITNLKKEIKKGSTVISGIDNETREYINTLPYYINEDICNYRIIVKYAKELNKESDLAGTVINSFTTIGVKL